MKNLSVDFRPCCGRLAQLAAVLWACLLCAGCSNDKLPILDWDTEAVIALKKAGADIRQTAAIGLPNSRGEEIDLTEVDVDDEIMGIMANVPDMIQLKLTGDQITDNTLAQFGEWKYLLYLYLNGTAVTDAGLDHLTDRKGLAMLQLNDTKVTAAGLEKLPESLSVLHLRNAPIGDDDLPKLDRFKRLIMLNLQGTQVTAAGANAYKKKRPGLVIMGIKLN